MAPQPRVFLDFTVGSQPLGRVVFELFTNSVPKTAENFRALCTGEKGISPISHQPLSYKNCPIHRVIEGFMIQGGDFTKKNGTGGESIYGGTFPDERLEGDGTQVDKEGLLVMANRGANTNGSQFFVTLAPAPHLTGKHVVFGRVVSGLEHIHTIGKQAVDSKDRPISPVIISHCGELELRKPPPRRPSPPPRRSDSRSISRSRSRSRSPSGKADKRGRDGNRSLSPRRRRRSRSLGSGESDSEHERKRRERKERKRERREKKDKRGRKKDREPKEETLDELDARLEREEKERLEAERIEQEAEKKRMKEQARQEAIDRDGVVYKGRGAMRYLDPEVRGSRKVPSNYDRRQPDIRPRGRAPYGAGQFGANGGQDQNAVDRRGTDGGPGRGAGGVGGRWERGQNVPRDAPQFSRGQPVRGGGGGDDLDRYRVKRADTGAEGAEGVGRDRRGGDEGERGDEGRERRKRDWDDWRVGRGQAYGERFERGDGSKGLNYGRRSRSRSRSRSSRRDGRDGVMGDTRGGSPGLRDDSPPRGDRSDAGSDMVLDADD